MHVFAAAKDAMYHDCSRRRALTHLLLTPPHQGALYQLISLHMVQSIDMAERLPDSLTGSWCSELTAPYEHLHLMAASNVMQLDTVHQTRLVLGDMHVWPYMFAKFAGLQQLCSSLK